MLQGSPGSGGLRAELRGKRMDGTSSMVNGETNCGAQRMSSVHIGIEHAKQSVGME